VARKPSLFRQAALDYFQQGPQREGHVLHISPVWARRAYQLLVVMIGVGVFFCGVGTFYEYASGPALVRMEGRTDLTVPINGIVAAVETLPGQRVEAGQVLVSFVADEERQALGRIRHEFELQLVRYMRDPSDTAAREALTSLRAERELAESRLKARTLTAPFSGVMGDVRIQPGQYLQAGTRALSLFREDARVFLLAFLPGYSRPFLRPGMSLRVELEGFRYDYQELTVESVGEQIIGPTELRRFLGAELADAVRVEGPIVLVRAKVSGQGFQSQGRAFSYFDGMPARAEARLKAESILLVLFPELKGLLPHEG
jgi:membrane fusion protein (multidrug efflux system)